MSRRSRVEARRAKSDEAGLLTIRTLFFLEEERVFSFINTRLIVFSF